MICYSGGAHGADAIWGRYGKMYGVQTKHFYVEGFLTPFGNCMIPKKEAVKADTQLQLANQTLKRTFPTKSDATNSLLRRNWYQVEDSDMVVAISTFVASDRVKGGTAWAVQMAIDLGIKWIYVFDQERRAWFRYHHDAGFSYCFLPNLQQGMQGFTGIGTRNINEYGKHAIAAFYNASLNILRLT